MQNENPQATESTDLNQVQPKTPSVRSSVKDYFDKDLKIYAFLAGIFLIIVVCVFMFSLNDFNYMSGFFGQDGISKQVVGTDTTSDNRYLEDPFANDSESLDIQDPNGNLEYGSFFGSTDDDLRDFEELFGFSEGSLGSLNEDNLGVYDEQGDCYIVEFIGGDVEGKYCVTEEEMVESTSLMLAYMINDPYLSSLIELVNEACQEDPDLLTIDNIDCAEIEKITQNAYEGKEMSPEEFLQELIEIMN